MWKGRQPLKAATKPRRSVDDTGWAFSYYACMGAIRGNSCASHRYHVQTCPSPHPGDDRMKRVFGVRASWPVFSGSAVIVAVFADSANHNACGLSRSAPPRDRRRSTRRPQALFSLASPAWHAGIYTRPPRRARNRHPLRRFLRPYCASHEAMAIQHRTQPSIFLTLKVLQFVNQLRRRLKPRLQGSNYPSLLGTELCLGLETKAIRSIAKGLSRVGLQDRKLNSHASDRVCKRRALKSRPSLKLQTPGQDSPTIQNVSGGEVQQYVFYKQILLFSFSPLSFRNSMLNSVDEKLSPSGSALSAIASDDMLFLKQNTAMSFDACSLIEIIQLLVGVHDSINVFYAARETYDDAWLVIQGQEVGLNIDEAFIANYEHLLMRLRAELIDALARKVFEALLLGGHDKKQRRLLDWFREFSGEPRPVCTSFPWTIKPSLAVLWGVCWMYYDNNPDARRAIPRANPRVPQAAVLQNVQLPNWNTPGSTDCEFMPSLATPNRNVSGANDSRPQLRLPARRYPTAT